MRRQKGTTKGDDVARGKLIDAVSNAFFQEKNTMAGKFNIFADILIFFIIVVYILKNTFTSVVRIIASIWNSALTKQTGDNIVTMIVIFIIASALCLGFMYITSVEKRKKENYLSQFEE